MHPRRNNIGAFIKVLAAILPFAAGAGTQNGTTHDRSNYGSCTLHGACGAASGAPSSQSVIFKLQDSVDGVTWTDFGDPTEALVADNGQVEVDFDLEGAKQNVRAVSTTAFTAGSSPSIPVSAVLVFGGAKKLPV